MGKFSSLFATALAVVTLASCSKESYTFRSNSAPYGTTYTAATKVEPVTETAAPAAEAVAPELTASTVATATAAKPAAARTYAAHAQAAKASVAKAETKAAPTRAEVKEAKQALKAMHKAAKKANPVAPQAGGKSQIVAAILAFFLGTLGVHRFYLGYTGKGFIFLALFLLGFVTFGITILAAAIWALIDFIRILTGGLQPKDGSYAQTL
jgi:TM2 domain-containing membrane protein YozV